MLMKEEKEMYEMPQCECINIATEGVICGSQGSQQLNPYEFEDGGGI